MYTVGFDISALDPQFKQHANRGIGRYVRELKKYFDGFKHDLVRIEYFSHRDLFSGEVIAPLLKALPAGATTIRQQVVFPIKLAQREDLSAVHFPAHMDGPAWGQKRRILTVLDLIPLVMEELYTEKDSGLRYRFARVLENRAIKSASRIVAISECTKRDLVRMLAIPEERITVTPLGVDDKFFHGRLVEEEVPLRARLKIPLERPIVLYVGGIDPRKNIKWMLNVWREVISTFGANEGSRPVLCLAGDIERDKGYQAVRAEIAALGLSNDIALPGFVNDEDLLQLFAISTVFFFPSLYEGFGLPPLEALAAGLPVVALNNSSIPEVLGGSAELVNTGDLIGAVKAIMELLLNEPLRVKRRELGREQARRFSWEKTGARTFEVYEKMARGI
jgi:glycosyltransferase involved in cell wall biosynthesis